MLLFKDHNTPDDDHHAQYHNKRKSVFQPRHVFKIHPIPPGDQGQREENRRYNRQKLHVAVLFCINLSLICFFYLLRVLQQMACPGS